ncbi:MAG TPA: hypothetical protein VFQ85_09700 [Mycobacteriales bacterium]|jgi:hypothetical protein|nr:hypothetical protein [Mycobacteriales bacterium]
MPRSLRKVLATASSAVVVTAVAVTAGVVGSAPSHASGPFDRAGSTAFPAGSAGIYVTFSAPMLDTKYAVTVQQTNTSNYSPTGVCTYFNVLKKTTTGFQVQHKECNTGVPQPLTVGVSLDWIAIPYA